MIPRALLSALAGYLSPDELREELTMAQKLWRELRTAEKKEQLDAPARRAFVADAHDRFARELGKREWRGFFADSERNRALSDHRFSARNALLPAEDFRTAAMVGNARTFFGSSNGEKPQQRIGR